MREPELDVEFTGGCPVSLTNNPRHTCLAARSQKLYAEMLRQLLYDKIQVLQVPGYISEETRKALLSCINNANRYDYLNDVPDPRTGAVSKVPYGVWRIGPAFNTIFGAQSLEERKKLWEEYWDQSVNARWDIKEALGEHASPLDTLDFDLRATGNIQIVIPNIEGLPAMSGIIRGTEAGHTPMVEKPHIDVMRDNTYFNVKRQLSAIIFLEAPENGGELTVWNSPLYDPACGQTETEFIEGAVSQNASVTVKPERGDLILFNTRHPHATTEFSESDRPRVAMQTFLGFTHPGIIHRWN